MTAHPALAAQLGAEPPAALHTLSAENAEHLAKVLRKARLTQSAEIAHALKETLEQVPWPLRSAVQKAIRL